MIYAGYVKDEPGKPQTGRVKSKFSPRAKEAKFSLGEGKKRAGSGFIGSVTEGCVSYLKAPEGFTLQRNCRREVLYKGADKLYIATVRR